MKFSSLIFIGGIVVFFIFLMILSSNGSLVVNDITLPSIFGDPIIDQWDGTVYESWAQEYCYATIIFYSNNTCTLYIQYRLDLYNLNSKITPASFKWRKSGDHYEIYNGNNVDYLEYDGDNIWFPETHSNQYAKPLFYGKLQRNKYN